MPPNTLYVGRPSYWGNPYKVGELLESKYPVTHEQAVAFFSFFIKDHLSLKAEVRRELKGKNLACWCPLDKACHADILIEIANQ